MPATDSTLSPRDPNGRQVELGRYSCDIGGRVIVGQRVERVVQLRDEPAAREGRSLLIEEGLDSMAELEAIVADYLARAQRRGFIPMFSLGW